MITSVDEIVVRNAFRGFGISDQDTTLNMSIVTLANGMAGDEQIKFTELFFYEETIYTQFLIFEAETKFQYLSWLCQMAKDEGTISHDPDFRDLGSSFSQLVYAVTNQRLAVAGLTQECSTTQIGMLVSERTQKYWDLMSKSVNCSDPVPDRPYNIIGISSRQHPFEKYMGEVGDNVVSSLNLENELLETFVRLAVVAKWNFHMDAVHKLLTQ